MASYKYGDMFQESWNRPGTLFIVTGNSTVKSDGSLVMGRGAALELKRRMHGIDRLLGERIRLGGPKDYGFIRLTTEEIHRSLGHWCRAFCDVGLLQVKRHFRDSARPELISLACSMLKDVAKAQPAMAINMNMPGTGCGRLSEAAVLPLLKDLPVNVNIWRFRHEAPKVRTYGTDSEDQGD